MKVIVCAVDARKFAVTDCGPLIATVVFALFADATGPDHVPKE